ncbi:hypothetical protein FIU87_08080 [Bacillus sp. THAF10]|uniref:hypothetical protein n=1 Tax=Bacillus sp. THAF10 TaxID=2587848 RepID=UPI001267C7B2|nr:hypothetical protein [Bacillus sp. THAF10]QFT88597.1 hypothetical protein FIU87_08080 [Bacillus sp. THAF10]
MESFFPVIALFLLAILVLSGSGIMTYLNHKVPFVFVILTMASFGILYSMLAKITSLLPVIITISTILSLTGMWLVIHYRSYRGGKRLEKQTP